MLLDRQKCSAYWHRKQQARHERERPNWGARLLFLIIIIWSILTLVALMS